jgi:predicted nucleic acid-binding protein
MSKPRVYVETTIPSAYHTSRTDADMLVCRYETRRWWKRARGICDLVTSLAVRQELAQGTSTLVASRLAMLDGLELVDPHAAVLETAAVYINEKLMPSDPLGDALHLALASHHGCDVLLTWNYLHLANPTKVHRIERVNRKLGLFVPAILSPRDMLEDDEWSI